MDLKNEILQVLKSKYYISDSKHDENKKMYKGRKYNYIYQFVLTVESRNFNIILGVPPKWEMELMDIYFKDVNNVPFIPHLEVGGNICLFDIEGALIESDFKLILNDILNRMYKIVFEGLKSINKEDFIIEFSAHWGKLPNVLVMHTDVELDIKTKEIVIMESKRNSKLYFASDKNKDFEFKDFIKFENKTINNGVYIYINSDEFIYPPDWRLPFKIEYVNKLLGHRSVDEKLVKSLLEKRKQSIILIFNINQPNGITSLFGVELESYQVIQKELGVEAKSMYPIYIERWDDDYLVNRGGGISDFKEKRILIIGCGSIGGYLINELVKAGFKNLSFTDYDTLSKENIYRHVLGLPFLYKNKAKAMSEYITSNIPHIKNKIDYYEEPIELLLENNNNLLESYDLIISAVGNHNLNRWINRYVYINKIDTPVIYGWNEALGIGSHVAFISRKGLGCYECFFKVDESTGNMYDRTSFSEKGQVFSKKMRGCFSSYIPFASETSITTMIAIIDVTKRYFENRLNCNLLKSVKGDSYYMEKEGYLISPKYNAQVNKEKDYFGNKFINNECGICNYEK